MKIILEQSVFANFINMYILKQFTLNEFFRKTKFDLVRICFFILIIYLSLNFLVLNGKQNNLVILVLMKKYLL